MKFVLFADDTNIFYSHHDVNKLCSLIIKELKTLNVWFAINKLSLNISKTHFMNFTNSTIKSDLNIYINNVGIDRVQVTKFLGVVIDEKLNWKEHVSYISKKINQNNCSSKKSKSSFK